MTALVWYEWFKAFHVIAAVLWVGGAFMLTVLAILTLREKDPVRLVGFTRQVAFLGERFFPLLSLTLLALGFAMIENGYIPWTYDMTWVQIGIAGWVFSFIVGVFYLAPRSSKLKKLLETRGPEDAEVQDVIHRLLWAARVDNAVLLFVVFDMAAKPWS